MFFELRLQLRFDPDDQHLDIVFGNRLYCARNDIGGSVITPHAVKTNADPVRHSLLVCLVSYVFPSFIVAAMRTNLMSHFQFMTIRTFRHSWLLQSIMSSTFAPS